ncbi:MAG: PAS domain S-box protein, partial [bacterium]
MNEKEINKQHRHGNPDTLHLKMEELENIEFGCQELPGEVQKHEDLHRSLAEHIPGIVFRVLLREERRMQFFNGMLQEITGFRPEELTVAGEVCCLEPFILPEDHPKVLAAVKSAIQNDEPYEVEYHLRHKSGSIRYVLERGRPIRGSDGQPLYIEGVILDNTRRKLAEEELEKYRVHLEEMVKERTRELSAANEQLQKEIEERKKAVESTRLAYAELEHIFDATAEGMVVISRDLKILRANKAFYHLFGLREDEVIGKKCFEIFHHFCFRSYNCPISWILSGEDHSPYELEIERSDGTKVPCISIAVPFRGIDGKLFGVIESFMDITERKRAEKALQESEAKYSALIEQARDGVCIVQDGILKFVNQALSESSGYQIEELEGKPFLDFIAPESRDLVAQRSARHLAGEDVPATYEVKIQCKSGATTDIEISCGLFQYGGRPAILAIARDITERKRREEELQKAQKLESIGILAGGIAHDYNNLLATVMGNLSLARMHAKPGNALLEALSEAEKASQQAKKLTRQLITFAKGGAPIRKIISISGLLQDTAALALSGSQTRAEFSLPDDLWKAHVDKEQISQAISNILINAAQAMPEGGVVEVQAENATISAEDTLPLQDGRYVKISIRDHGTGIPEEHLQKIFDPYFSTKEKGARKGMGLGLSIAHSIVKQHRGFITVGSEPKMGTSFHIYLPPAERGALQEKEGKEKTFTGKGKVLVMDDEKMFENLSQQMLRGLGFEVEFVKDGAEAIEVYK